MYIEREALFKALSKLPGVGGMAVLDEEAVWDTIRALPVVDAEEVIRCKECKHYDTGIYGAEEMICTFWAEHLETNPDDFCSYGERRDNDVY